MLKNDESRNEYRPLCRSLIYLLTEQQFDNILMIIGGGTVKRFMVGDTVYFVESNTRVIGAEIVGNQYGRYIVAYNGGNTKIGLSDNRLFATATDAMAAVKRSVPVRQKPSPSSWRFRMDIPVSEPGDGWTGK